MSAIGTFNYNCAKFLVPILSPLTLNDYTVKNSIEFAKELRSLKLSEPYYLASFDVKSLFTNIPLDETIEICVKECERLELIPFDLTKRHFHSLLEIAVKESVFIFDDQLYQQTDGVAMGSPLGPTLANAFLCYHENNWLADCPIEFRPIKYNRYVDDCFLVFKCKSHTDKFLEYLNNKHRNISFTVEQEQNKQLPFLDIMITRDGDSLVTDVYRKPTYTGLGLNFYSFVPNLFKFNSIKTLLHRAYNMCNDWHKFHLELERLKHYFHVNSYPSSIVEKHIKSFITSKFVNKKIDEQTKEIKYIRLPFLGHSSYHLRSKLSTLLSKNFPEFKFKFIFVNNNTIGSLFRTKDPMPVLLCSNVVYSFTCPDCMSRYVGSTSRNLKIRIAEHKGISHRTNIRITKPSFSRIRDHALSEGHHIDEQDFEIKYSSRYLSE